MGRNEVTYGQLLHGYSMIPCPKENCCFVCCLFHRDSSLCGNSDFSGLVFVCLIYALLRGETLNYKMVAMDDFKPAYLGIHLCPEFSFCFVSSETKRYCFQFRGELFT